MKNLVLATLYILFGTMTFNLSAQATLSIQGVIKNSDGTAVEDGDYEMTFKVYDNGVEEWSETISSVNVKGGVYSVIMGSDTLNPLPPFTSANYELGVSIEGGQELQPRSKITAAPSALALVGNDNLLSGNGNVGIGTKSPVATLDVDGSVKLGSSGLMIDENGVSMFMNHLITNGHWISGDGDSEGISVSNDGSVGIGTQTPTEKLHISDGNALLDRGTTESGVTRSVTISGARNTSGSHYAELNFENFDSNDGMTDYVGARISSSNDVQHDSGDMSFEVRDSGSGNLEERMRLSTAGVQIGSGGDVFENIVTASIGYNVPNISGNSSHEYTFSVPGATANSAVMVSPSADYDGGIVMSFARGLADQVKVRWRNTDGTGRDLPTMTYRIVVINF